MRARFASRMTPIELPVADKRCEMLLSPLRYPGGKASLGPYLAHILSINGLQGCAYYEPFAGGAGAALYLLSTGLVTSIHLNDADPCIYAFWKAVLFCNKKLCRALEQIDVTIDEWHKQRAICLSPHRHTGFDLAVATLFLNRCNRSGILLGAGPIGGMEQKGKYKLNARFYRDTLIERLQALKRFKRHIRIYNLDAEVFLKKIVPKRRTSLPVFVYLDPPYYNNGRRLYLNSYTHLEHQRLSEYLSRRKSLNWLLSYDDAPAIRQFYEARCPIKKKLKYSLNVHRSAHELLIFSDRVSAPR